MIETRVKIINKLGLHARASAKFVSTASRFQSQIEVIKDAHKVNGKSIMGIMMLEASQNSELDLHIHGPDEEEMSKAMMQLIENRFGELE